MELDDLKTTWQELPAAVAGAESNGRAKSPVLSAYRNLNCITVPELIGSLVCLAGAGYTLFNFQRLHTVFLQGTAVLALILLLLIPLLGISSIYPLRRRPNLLIPYADALRIFALQKIHFFKLQRMNVLLTYLLLVAVIILIPAFTGGGAINRNGTFLTFAFCSGYIFLLFYSIWVYRKYKQAMQKTESILKDLADEK